MLVNSGRLVGASIFLALAASSFAACSAADNQEQNNGAGGLPGQSGGIGGVSATGAKSGTGGVTGGGGLGSGNLPSSTPPPGPIRTTRTAAARAP
jgi:hypothetical protein